MGITNKQKKSYIESCIKALEKLEVREKAVHCSDFKMLFKFVNAISNNEILKKYISVRELGLLFFNRANEFYLEEGQKKKGTFKDIFNKKDIENLATEFIDFLKGVPYECIFYFVLPIEIPKEIKVININNDVEIVREDTANIGNIPSGLLSGYPFEIPRGEHTFLKVHVIGHGEQAQEQAVTILKYFLYLTSSTGLFLPASWKGFGSSVCKNGLSICPSIDNKKIFSFALVYDIGNYISGIKLSDKIFNGFTPPKKGRVTTVLSDHNKTYEDFLENKFQRCCGTFIKLQNNKKLPDIGYIFTAIEWASDGAINHNKTMGFIQTCIGIEALLGGGNEDQGRVKAKLADRASYLIGNSRDERKDIHKQIIDIYKLRSELVHGAMSPKVSDENEELILKAEELLRKMIFKEIWLDSK